MKMGNGIPGVRSVERSRRFGMFYQVVSMRHNQVLQILVEAMESACSKANARESVPQRRMYFLREGASQYARSKCKTPRRDLLENANDWMTAADIGGKKHYPQVIQESGQRPDAVVASKKNDTIIVAELTVPWEDRMEHATCSKKIGILNSRWTSLTKGIKCTSLPSKLEHEGSVGRSSYTFLREIGLPGREWNKVMERMSKAAETVSHWLWTKRDSQ